MLVVHYKRIMDLKLICTFTIVGLLLYYIQAHMTVSSLDVIREVVSFVPGRWVRHECEASCSGLKATNSPSTFGTYW